MNEVEALYRGLTKKDNTFKHYDSSYLFTTENIKGYMPNLDGKDVLTITSSGDHYFNALLNGAKNIDLFDINCLTIHILKLKKAAIENIDLDVFNTFFDINNIENFFRYDIYIKFNKYLDTDTYLFWEYIYSLASHKGYNIYNSNILYELHCSISEIGQVNNYLDESNYMKLKKILSSIKKINFINSDIFDLDKRMSKKYDFMFFSNINDYCDKNYIKIVMKLDKFLNEYGNIYFAYLYNYEVNPQNYFYSNLLRQNKNLYGQIVKGTDSYFMESQFKDKILIYSKG